MTERPSILYALARSIILPIYSIFVKTIIEGEHFLPTTGPVIIAGNHISFIDPVAMGYLGRRRKRQIHFLAKDSLFKNPILGWFFKACRQIPVERETERAADSLIHAQHSLEHGHAVGIYPESTMPVAQDYKDMTQLPIKSGALRMSSKTRAPIVVVGSWGAQDTWRKGKLPKPRFRRRHVLVVLPGFVVDENPDMENAKHELASKMMDATEKAKKKLGEIR